MKNTLLKFSIIGCLFISAGGLLRAQENQANGSDPKTTHTPDYDARLLNHYKSEELDNLRVNAPEKFVVIQYYYTQSYIIEPIDCGGCVPVDFSTFDVSVYEKYRLLNDRWTHTFYKYGFKLTLLSLNELEYLTPMQRDIVSGFTTNPNR